jgi:hypothetical protein
MGPVRMLTLPDRDARRAGGPSILSDMMYGVLGSPSGIRTRNQRSRPIPGNRKKAYFVRVSGASPSSPLPSDSGPSRALRDKSVTAREPPRERLTAAVLKCTPLISGGSAKCREVCTELELHALGGTRLDLFGEQALSKKRICSPKSDRWRRRSRARSATSLGQFLLGEKSHAWLIARSLGSSTSRAHLAPKLTSSPVGRELA